MSSQSGYISQQVVYARGSSCSIRLGPSQRVEDRVASDATKPIAKAGTAWSSVPVVNCLSDRQKNLLSTDPLHPHAAALVAGHAIDDGLINRHELRPCERILRIAYPQDQTFARFRPLAHVRTNFRKTNPIRACIMVKKPRKHVALFGFTQPGRKPFRKILRSSVPHYL